MTIFFTICSSNYLPYARSLAESLSGLEFPNKFIIGFADEVKPDSYSLFDQQELLSFRDLQIENVDELIQRSNIVEFNTAIKPFFFQYFFKKYGEDVKVFYLDPDLYFYQSPEILIDALDHYSILLTPQLNSLSKYPFEDEVIALRHGVFNLGFLGLRNCEESRRLIGWWADRLQTHCKIDKSRGLFVDQKWMDLVPVFFTDYHVLKNNGCNVAWWNLSERKLFQSGNKWYLNSDTTPLVFFHFSGFHPRSPYYTGRAYNPKFSFADKPELLPLFRDYEQKLLLNGYDALINLKPMLPFRTLENKHGNTGTKKRFLQRVKMFITRNYLPSK